MLSTQPPVCVVAFFRFFNPQFRFAFFSNPHHKFGLKLGIKVN